MASKRRGRPRKRAISKSSQANRAVPQGNQPEVTVKLSSDPISAAEKVADDLSAKVRSMFSKSSEAPKEPELPSVQIAEENPRVDSSIPSATSSAASGEVHQLAQTVAEVKERFGPAPTPAPPRVDTGSGGFPLGFGSGNGAGGAAGQNIDPGPAQVEAPDHHFMPPETVRQILELIFSAKSGAMAKLSPDESRALTPINVDMLDEQGPRLFGESQNKALWIWLTVMGTFIAVRSEAGAKLIQWITDAVTGVQPKKVEDSHSTGGTGAPEKQPAQSGKGSTQSEVATISPGSLEFTVSSGFQAPGKPL